MRVSNRVNQVLPIEIIQSKIYLIREQKVILDKELAELYGVSTNRLKEQVRRNLKRFPSDFMFELTWEETSMFSSRPQFAGLKKGTNVKYLSYAFTEQGVAMLSSVLKSDRAIEVNIQIMRIFTKLRKMMLTHRDLAIKIEELERKHHAQDKRILDIFDAIKQLVKDKEDENKNKGPMGFYVVKK